MFIKIFQIQELYMPSSHPTFMKQSSENVGFFLLHITY